METRPSESANFQIAPIKVKGRQTIPTIYELKSKYDDLLFQDHTAAQVNATHQFKGISASEAQFNAPFEPPSETNKSHAQDYGSLALSSGSLDIIDFEVQNHQIRSSRLRNSQIINQEPALHISSLDLVQESVVRMRPKECDHTGPAGVPLRCKCCGRIFIARK